MVFPLNKVNSLRFNISPSASPHKSSAKTCIFNIKSNFAPSIEEKCEIYHKNTGTKRELHFLNSNFHQNCTFYPAIFMPIPAIGQKQKPLAHQTSPPYTPCIKKRKKANSTFETWLRISS